MRRRDASLWKGDKTASLFYLFLWNTGYRLVLIRSFNDGKENPAFLCSFGFT